jgi:hypothetical protein
MYSIEKKNQAEVKPHLKEDKANEIQPQVAPQLKSVSASNVMQLQRLIGNRAVQRLVAQQKPQQPKIQRAIDETKVEEFKELLNLGSVTIVEVPNSSAVKLDTKFSAYPDGSTYNAGAIQGMSLLDINYGEAAVDMRTDPDSKDFLASKAYDIVDGSGGGGYMHSHNMVMYNQGISNVNRAILHEMGHAKQNEGGANLASANQIILEYHNVLVNENRFVDLEEGKGQALRTNYLDSKPTSKSRSKTWENLITHATGGTNPQKEQNQKLINEILAEIEKRKEYKEKADQIKMNLVYEYFNRF